MSRLDRIERAIEALQKSQLKTDEQLAKTDRQLAKTDAQLAQTDEKLSALADQLAKTERILSGIGINLGDAAEDFFAHSLQEKKMLGDKQFDAVALQLKAHKGKVQDEFDIVLYNGDAVGLVEVKHKVHPSDIENLLHRKLRNFRLLFPMHASSSFYLGIAGMSFPREVAVLAEKAGIGVLRQKGDVLVMNRNLRPY
jgi:hypothetical protein